MRKGGVVDVTYNFSEQLNSHFQKRLMKLKIGNEKRDSYLLNFIKNDEITWTNL